MNLLLDTHAWLWFHLGDPRLSAAVRSHIVDPANAKFVSSGSCWEISIKIGLGKFTLGIPYAQFMCDSIAGQGFQYLPITTLRTERISTLPMHHRDPFDRLLIAQAGVDGMKLVSGDRILAPYGVPLIW